MRWLIFSIGIDIVALPNGCSVTYGASNPPLASLNSTFYVDCTSTFNATNSITSFTKDVKEFKIQIADPSITQQLVCAILSCDCINAHPDGNCIALSSRDVHSNFSWEQDRDFRLRTNYRISSVGGISYNWRKCWPYGNLASFGIQ